jgi:hypothetical protein
VAVVDENNWKSKNDKKRGKDKGTKKKGERSLVKV